MKLHRSTSAIQEYAMNTHTHTHTHNAGSPEKDKKNIVTGVFIT